MNILYWLNLVLIDLMGKSTIEGPRLLSHCIFFMGTMFELQSCHYYKRFSQFYYYYGNCQNPKKSNVKEITFLSNI